MSDPRNVAHDKKVKQEKEHHKSESDSDSKPVRAEQDRAVEKTSAPMEKPKAEEGPADLEKSVTVLSKLKQMEFHSRANIETLAGLTLTIEDELKQKEFAEPIGALYSAQGDFQTKVAALIESYSAKCESLKPSA